MLYVRTRWTGRGIGELLGRNSRAYALVGGAGILGGITRMTLSVTVMMVEASGWVLFVIPLMLVFIVARSVGNRFNEGIYDTQISIKKMPFLEQVSSQQGRRHRKGEVPTRRWVVATPLCWGVTSLLLLQGVETPLSVGKRTYRAALTLVW